MKSLYIPLSRQEYLQQHSSLVSHHQSSSLQVLNKEIVFHLLFQSEETNYVILLMRTNFTNLFQVEIVVFLFLSKESDLVKQFFPNVSKSVVDGEQDDLDDKTKNNKQETTNHKVESI